MHFHQWNKINPAACIIWILIYKIANDIIFYLVFLFKKSYSCCLLVLILSLVLKPLLTYYYCVHYLCVHAEMRAHMPHHVCGAQLCEVGSLLSIASEFWNQTQATRIEKQAFSAPTVYIQLKHFFLFIFNINGFIGKALNRDLNESTLLRGIAETLI